MYVCVYVYVCVHDEYLYNIYIQIFPMYNTVRRTIISEARAFSREDSRQRDEIEKKLQSEGSEEKGEMG